MQDIKLYAYDDSVAANNAYPDYNDKRRMIDITKYVTVPFDISLKLDTSLDSASFTMLVNPGTITDVDPRLRRIIEGVGHTFKHFTRFEMHINGEILRWVSMRDDYEEVQNFVKDRVGFNTVSLIEPSKMLERITIPSMTVTQRKISEGYGTGEQLIEKSTFSGMVHPEYKIDQTNRIVKSAEDKGFNIRREFPNKTQSDKVVVPITTDFSTSTIKYYAENNVIKVVGGEPFRMSIAGELLNHSYLQRTTTENTIDLRGLVELRVVGESGTIYHRSSRVIPKAGLKKRYGFLVSIYDAYFGNLSVYDTFTLEPIPSETGVYVELEVRSDSSEYRPEFPQSIRIAISEMRIALSDIDKSVAPDRGESIADVLAKGTKAIEGFDVRTSDQRYKLDISADSFNILTRSKCPEFVWVNPTYWEFLLKCSAYVNALPRLGKTDWTTVSFDFLDSIKRDMGIINHYSKNTGKASDYYTSAIEVDAVNAVESDESIEDPDIDVERSRLIVDPAEDNFVGVRVGKIANKLTEDNAIIPSRYGIYELKKVLVKLQNAINIDVAYVSGESTTTKTYKAGDIIDITEMVSTSEKYNTLPEKANFTWNAANATADYKNNNLFFERSKPNIYALGRTPKQLNIDVVKEKQSLINAISCQLIRNVIDEGHTFESVTVSGMSEVFQDFTFNLWYACFEDFNVRIARDDSEGNTVRSNLYYNNNDKIVDIRDLGDVVLDKINRNGLEVISLSGATSDFLNIPKPGDIVEGRVVTNVDISVDNFVNTYNCTLSANAPYISNFIGLESAIRSYEIPAKAFIRRNDIVENIWRVEDVTDNVINSTDSNTSGFSSGPSLTNLDSYKYNIAKFGSATLLAKLSVMTSVLSPDEKGSLKETTSVDAYGVRLDIFRNVEIDSASTYLHHFGSESDINLDDLSSADTVLSLPTNVSVSGTTIAARVDFKDNYSAGSSITSESASGTPYYFEREIPYTNSLGGLPGLSIDIGTDTQTTALVGKPLSQTLPEVKSSFTNKKLFTNRLYPEKDQREAYSVTNSIAVKGIEGVVVHPGFVKYSRLGKFVYEAASSNSDKLWTKTRAFFVTDKDYILSVNASIDSSKVIKAGYFNVAFDAFIDTDKYGTDNIMQGYLAIQHSWLNPSSVNGGGLLARMYVGLNPGIGEPSVDDLAELYDNRFYGVVFAHAEEVDGVERLTPILHVKREYTIKPEEQTDLPCASQAVTDKTDYRYNLSLFMYNE